MAIDALLSRVQGLKKTSATTWMCKCPSHQDRRPSLSLRQADDGRVLVNCFGGCSVEDVLGSLGLTIDELFEQPLYHRAKPIRGSKVYPRDVLQLLRTEVMIVMISAFDLRKNRPLSDIDLKRLQTAYDRIAYGLELAEVE